MKRVIILLPLFFVIIAYGIWLVPGKIFTQGDASFLTDTSLSNYVISAHSMWISNIQTGTQNIGLAWFLRDYMLGIFAIFFGSGIAMQIIFFWPTLIFGLFIYFLSGKYFFKSNLAGVITAVTFSLSVGTMGVRSGHVTLAVAYSFFPLTIIALDKAWKKGSMPWFLILALANTLLGYIEFRALYLAYIVQAMYILLYLTKDRKALINIGLYILAGFITLLLNLFWILPFIFISKSTGDFTVLSRNLFGSGYTNLLIAITNWYPYWTGGVQIPFLVQSIPNYFFLVPMLIIIMLVFYRQSKFSLFLLLVLVIGTFFGKLNSDPLPEIYEWFFKNIPGFNAFREPGKFYFFVTFSYSLLLGYLALQIWNDKHMLRKRILGGLFIVMFASVFLINAYPLATGKLGATFVPRSFPTDYNKINPLIENSTEPFFRTLAYPSYIKWVTFTTNRPMVGYVGEFSQTLSKICKEKPNTYDLPLEQCEYMDNLFDIYGIKYLVVPGLDIKNDNNIFDNFQNRDYYIYQANTAPFLSEINLGTKEVRIYENKGFYPRIYTASKLQTLRSRVPYTVPVYKNHHPTRYEFEINNQNTYVYFSDAYHPDWKLRIGEFSWVQSLFDSSYSYPDKYHIKTDAGLNAWKVDPAWFLENGIGKGNQKITIYFASQVYVYVGLIISGITLFGIVTYLAFFYAKKILSHKS